MFTLLLRSSNIFFHNKVFPSSSHLNQGECSWIRPRSGTMFSFLQWHGQMQESWELGFSPVLRAVERSCKKGEGGRAFKKPTKQKNFHTPKCNIPTQPHRVGILFFSLLQYYCWSKSSRSITPNEIATKEETPRRWQNKKHKSYKTPDLLALCRQK